MSKLSQIVQGKQFFDGVALKERLQECHTPALSMVIIENCEISEVHTLGVRRRGRKEEVTPETIFQAASISKPVFAALVMGLAERGLLDINEDISAYLTDYTLPTFDQQSHKVTLRQILSHHAGLNLHGFAGYRQGQRIPTTSQILRGAYPANHLKLKLMKNPDTEFQYSGGGYVLAEKIVGDLCGRGVKELLDDLVLIPFAMTHSTYAQPLPGERVSDAAFGYNSHGLQLTGGYNIMPELAAAGLWATPSDLALFGITMMKALKGQSSVISKESAEAMITATYEYSPYGVGFAVAPGKKGFTFGHSGSNIGYRCNMCFCPADGSGMVVMHNSDIGANIIGEVTNAFKTVSGW